MGLFRSEDMTLCSLYLQAETAYANIAELGELGIVHFRDVSIAAKQFQCYRVSAPVEMLKL
jgi:V-type H+-transporting ATPase subunit a